jgi:hypothetical protein
VPPLPEATANALPTPKQIMLPVAGGKSQGNHGVSFMGSMGLLGFNGIFMGC